MTDYIFYKGCDNIDIAYHIQDFVMLLKYQIKTIGPYWALGVLLGSLLLGFFSSRIKTLAFKISMFRYTILSAAASSVLGALSPITAHGAIPLLAALGTGGIPLHLLTSFIVSSILINPNLFIFSLALGAPIALMRLFLSIAAGILAGVFIKRLPVGNVFDFERYQASPERRIEKSTKLKSFIKTAGRSASKTGKNLLIGIVLTALFDKFFPRELFYSLFSANKGMGVLFAASMGVPIYFCGGGTIPLINAWLQQGMSLGSAAAFMITGPATKLNNLTAIKNITKGRGFVMYIIYSIAFGTISGLSIDLIISLLE